ncbi:MAG: diacylglycerol kinase family lipid kinase [Flavobacteriales bacterium]|nr:diacylglycerol kinase family lipid kinase [Flavobacteriales bacterium]
MKIRFIINPISGTGKQKGIEQYIAMHFNNYDIVRTQKAREATALSKEAVEQKFDAVIAVGGDGTVNECAKALIGSNTALGVIPCGSGNGFAFHNGMSSNVEKAIIQLKNASIKTIDSCTANGLPFVNVSGIGFDAHIAHLFSNLKERGFLNYLKLIKNEVFTYQAKEYHLNYNGKSKKVTANLIAFANASQYGNDFCISPKAETNDGLIDFVIVKELPKWKIPQLLFTVAKGKIHLSKFVRIIQTDKMIITSQEKLIHLDGEPTEVSTTLEIKSIPKSLKIFIPNGEK